MNTSVDLNVALRWLGWVRLQILVAVGLLGILAELGWLEPTPLLPTMAVCATLVAVWLWQRSRTVRGPGAVMAHVGVDVAALAALVALSPDAHLPLLALFLVETAVAATVLDRVPAVVLATVTAVVQALAALVPAAWTSDPELAHLASHAALFGGATIATTTFVAQLSSALRHSEAVRSDTDRLAAMGALGAGIAHELATPLSAVGLLASEVAEPSLPTAERTERLSDLQGQLERCHGLLDRLKGGGSEVGKTRELARLLPAWVSEWQDANPGALLPVTTVPATLGAVRGEAERWRGVVWTLLDNARVSGSTTAEVRAEVTTQGPWQVVCLTVDDRGCGMDAHTERHAGEPFYTRWPDGRGRGLGLYVARTWARTAGGELVLEGRQDGGARVTVWMTREDA